MARQPAPHETVVGRASIRALGRLQVLPMPVHKSHASSAEVQGRSNKCHGCFPAFASASIAGPSPFMIVSLPLLAWLSSLIGVAEMQPVAVTRLVVHQEVILRVPVIRPRMPRPIKWEEKKGPKCIGADKIVAAALANERSVDFLLRDRTRIRARMDDDCPTLDFYGNFYIQPEDERVCAKRDEIRSRIGGSCRIEKFRRMVPRPL